MKKPMLFLILISMMILTMSSGVLADIVITDLHEGTDQLGNLSENYWRRGQSFSIGSEGGNITGFKLWITSKVGSPTDVKADLVSTLDGSILATSTITPTIGQFNDFIFDTPYELSPRQTYYIQLEEVSNVAGNYYNIGRTSTNPYLNGRMWQKVNEGSWGSLSLVDLSMTLYTDFEMTCVIPIDNLQITQDLTFCSGDYYVKGIAIMDNDITLTLNNTNFHSNTSWNAGNSWGGVQAMIEVWYTSNSAKIICVEDSTFYTDVFNGNYTTGIFQGAGTILQTWDSVDVEGCNFVGNPNSGQDTGFLSDKAPNTILKNNNFVNSKMQIGTYNYTVDNNYIEEASDSVRLGSWSAVKIFEGQFINNEVNLTNANNFDFMYVGDLNMSGNHFYSDGDSKNFNMQVDGSGRTQYVYDNVFDNVDIYDQRDWGSNTLYFCVDGISNTLNNGEYNGDSQYSIWCPEISVSNVQTSYTQNSISVTGFTVSPYSPALRYVEWYIDGSLDDNNSDTSHTYNGLTQDQEYNITFIAYGDVDTYDSWEGFITAEPDPNSCASTFQSNCNLDTSLTLTQDYYDIQNIQIRANDVTLDCGGYTINGDWNGTDGGSLIYPQEASGNHNGFTLQNCVIRNTRSLFDTSPTYGFSNVVLDNIDISGEGMQTESMTPNFFGGNWGANGIANENITLKNSQITDIFYYAQDNDHWNDAENSIYKNFYVYNTVFNGAGYPQGLLMFQSINGVYVYNNTFNGNGVMQNSIVTISDSYNIEFYDNNVYEGESFRIGEENWGDANFNVLVYNNNIEVQNVISLNILYTQFYNNNLVVTDGQVQGYFDGDMNITGNNFNPDNGYLTLIGANDENEYFYNNNVNQIYDNTDTGAGDYITFCVDGLGNNINEYNGNDENSGTCPPPNCAESFESGCRVSSDVTLTPDTYNVVNIITGNSEPITLDCQGSIIRGDWTAEGEDRSNFIKIYNEDVTIKNCVFEDYWSIISVQDENAYGLVFDNIRWESDIGEWQYYCNDPQDEPDPEQCNDPSYWMERPNFNLNSQKINGMTIQNSYFGGTTYMRIEQGFWWNNGDFCPDNNGDYVQNSENCLNWEYQDTEENCLPEMWNGNVCLDSRGVWQGGSCNECGIDWQWYNGEWYSCDYSNNIDGFTAINNVFNTTDFDNNNDDNMWFTLYTVDNILIENNTWYARDVNDYGTVIMRISGSNGATIKGNDVYGGQGFQITPHDWDSPRCSNNNIVVEDNTFHLSTPSFWYNWFTSMNNSVIRNNICDFNNNPDVGMCMYINNDNSDEETYNLDVYGNEFINYAEPYDCGNAEQYYPCEDYGMIIAGWGNVMNNVNVYDNNFQGTVHLNTVIHNNFNFYNNNVPSIFIDSIYNPETNKGADICYGGVGNTYNEMMIDVTRNDKWFDPACSILNVPNGMWLDAYSNPETSPLTINATGITLTGNGYYGLSYIGNYYGQSSRLIKDISVYGLSIEGFNRSLYFNDESQDNIFSGNIFDKWYVDLGSNNDVSYNSYTCVEDYAPTYSTCINSTHTVDYIDMNDCGSTENKPDSFQENCSLEIDCGESRVYLQGNNYVMENDCIKIILKKQYSPTLEIYNTTETEEYSVGTNKKWKMVVQGIEERDLESEDTTFIDFSDLDWTATVQDGWIKYTTDTYTLTYVVDGDTAKTDLTINDNFVYEYPESELWLKTYYKTGVGDYIRYTAPIVDNVTMPIEVEYITEAGNKTFTYQNLYSGLNIYVDPIYEPCIEWWLPEYGTCGVDDQQLLTYYDANVCGSDVDLPEDNNTMVYCNYCSPTFGLLKGTCENDFKANATYYLTNEESCCALTNLSTDCDVPADTRVNCAGLHSISDITGLVVDGGVELGRNYILYVGLIALIGIGVWAFSLYSKKV